MMRCTCGGQMYKQGAGYECAKCYCVVHNSSELASRHTRKEQFHRELEEYKKNMSPRQKKTEEYLKKHPRASIILWH